MGFLGWLLLLAGVIWAMRKAGATRDEMEVLQRRVDRLEVEVRLAKADRPAPATQTVTESRTTPPATDQSLAASPPPPRDAPPQEVASPQLVSPIPPALKETSPDGTPPLVPPLFEPQPEPALKAKLSAVPGPGPLSQPALSAPVAKPMAINWEQFMGVKMFMWLGGLALFLTVAFSIKYSFDNNLIPPVVRVALGFLTGIGLVVGGVVIKRKAYVVASQTLCATGIVILYAVTFAAHALPMYHFLESGTAFALMALITVTAFFLAVRMEAQVVAILGLLGGFLTPPLLSTGQDRPLGLFGYVAILDLGLLTVALRRQWLHLVGMAAVGTLVMQAGWAMKFFEVAKLTTAWCIFAAFPVLFTAAYAFALRRDRHHNWLAGSAAGLTFFALFFTMATLADRVFVARPGTLIAFLLAADLCLLAMVCLNWKLQPVFALGGAFVFVILSVWIGGQLPADQLNWALGACFGLAVLHSVAPVVLARRHPDKPPAVLTQVFPLVALGMMMIPLMREMELSWLFWPCVLGLNVLAILLALVTFSIMGVMGAMVLTIAVIAAWILKLPTMAPPSGSFLVVVGGFAVVLFVLASVAGEKLCARLAESEDEAKTGPSPEPDAVRRAQLAQLPALAAIMPFLLLILATLRLPMPNPAPVYGLGMLLTVLLLGTARAAGTDLLAPVGLGCVLALEHIWYFNRFNPEMATMPLLWAIAFMAVFWIYPFLFRQSFLEKRFPWIASALAGPLHFYLLYHLIKRGWPNHVMGLAPAILALPALASLATALKAFPEDAERRRGVLAWYGGCALFFITAIFPIQFSKQWITLGWALEGAALLWLFHRIPHPGLRLVGSGLLTAVFVRLALNPAVLEYHARSGTPIFNWYLYTYGVACVCLLAGTQLLAPPRERAWGLNVQAILGGQAVVLAFLLINIEIADYFSTGANLAFNFDQSFKQDMTYSIAWGNYALVLVGCGIWRSVPALRYTGIALLAVTLLKLFFRDLVRLEAPYRIGAFLGVAIISILASLLYQRFFAKAAAKPVDAAPLPPS